MRQVPGPQGHYLHGNLKEFQANPQAFLLDNALRYGDLVRFRLGFQPCFLVSEPAEIQKILAQPEAFRDKRPGERMGNTYPRSVARLEEPEHRQRRRLLQPAFRATHLEAGVQATVQATEEAIASWGDGQIRPLFPMLKRVILNSLLLQLLGTPAARHYQALATPIATIEAWLGNATHIQEEQFREAQKQLKDVFLALFAEQDGQNPADPPTLMRQLLKGATTPSKALNEEVLIDELAMLLMTNIPTTLAATWAGYHLAAAASVRARLEQELEAVVGAEPVQPAHLSHLHYLDQVVREALRLHPPVWTLAREARIDWTIGPYTLPAGSEVLMSPYVLQRHPRYWERPEDFLPERFDPGTPVYRECPRLAWFPFGAGQRKCIGERMTLLLIKAILATLVQRFRLELPGAQAGQAVQFTTRPQDGWSVVVQRRSNENCLAGSRAL